MSTCECGHDWACHENYSPWHRRHYGRCHGAGDCPCIAPPPTAERRSTMIDKTPPYVIDPKDARVGDVLELSGYKDDPKQRITGTLNTFGSVGGWRINDAPKITLLDRPEPPKPALPTTPGVVIRCAINGDAGATLIRGRTYWHGIAPEGFAVQNVNSPASPDRITDWTVVYDPTAPKADDGLRERVEELAGQYEQFPHLGTSHRSVALTLREALTDGADQ